MFRIYYEIKIRHSNKELYNPTEVYKVYNYIKANTINNENISIGDKLFINNIEQVVKQKTEAGFFIAPGIYVPPSAQKPQYSISINGNEYNLTFDPYDNNFDQILVGSIVIPFNTNLFKDGDHCRLINYGNNIVNMKYFDVINIQKNNGLYLHDSQSTSLYFYHYEDLLEWLSKAGDIGVHSITSPKQDVDITLYLRCYGGSPSFSILDTLPKYNLELHNLTTGDTIQKSISQFHNEKLNAKHLYEFKISDSLNQKPLMINDIADNTDNITIDLSSNSIQFIANQLAEVNPVLSPLSLIR